MHCKPVRRNTELYFVDDNIQLSSQNMFSSSDVKICESDFSKLTADGRIFGNDHFIRPTLLISQNCSLNLIDLSASISNSSYKNMVTITVDMVI